MRRQLANYSLDQLIAMRRDLRVRCAHCGRVGIVDTLALSLAVRNPARVRISDILIRARCRKGDNPACRGFAMDDWQLVEGEG